MSSRHLPHFCDLEAAWVESPATRASGAVWKKRRILLQRNTYANPLQCDHGFHGCRLRPNGDPHTIVHTVLVWSDMERKHPRLVDLGGSALVPAPFQPGPDRCRLIF